VLSGFASSPHALESILTQSRCAGVETGKPAAAMEDAEAVPKESGSPWTGASPADWPALPGNNCTPSGATFVERLVAFKPDVPVGFGGGMNPFEAGGV
jgi:hypothetical protein